MTYSLLIVKVILFVVLVAFGLPALVAFLINSHTDIGLVALLALICSIGAYLGYQKVKN